MKAHPLLVPAIAASQLAAPFMISGVAVALPALGADLNAGATALSLVETLFLAASVSALLPFGRLGDAGDKAKLYKLGLAAFALSSIAIGLAASTGAVLVLRFVQGLASAAIQAGGPALVADVVPPERRGKAFGIVIGSVYAGLTLGPVAAGFLVDLWGWRAVFLVGGALVLMLLVPLQLLLKNSNRPVFSRSVHVPSTALVMAAMLALVAGAATLREGPLGYAGVALGLALFVPFVVLQRRVAAPLLNVEVLMRNRVLRNALLAQWLLYTNAFGAVFLLSLHLQSVLGQTANTAGQVIAVGSLLMALVAPFAGSLADRYRAQRIAAIGIAVGIVSALMGARLDALSGLLAVGLVLAVQGLGFAFFSSPNMALIMNAVPPERTGIASALGATARALGMVSGMLIVAALVSINLGHEPVGADPAAFVATLQVSFWILVGTTSAALVIGLRR